MTTKTKIILGIIAATVLVAAGTFLAWRQYSHKSVGIIVPQENDGGKNVAPANNTAGAVNTDKQSASADTLSDILNKPIPDAEPILSRTIPIGADAAIVAEIKKVIELLRGNYDFRDGWINLGIYREKIKDYEGAAEAWEYASAIRPFDPVPLINLGNLYGYYVHDNQKAEEYFLKAIQVKPNDAYSYYRAYEFYYDISELAKAKDILKKGIAADPANAKDLISALNSLQ